MTIYTLLKHFPVEEKYALGDQMRRAVISVPSNIAEGLSRTAPKEQAHFLDIAYGSLMEIDCQLDISLDLRYISPEMRQMLDIEITAIAKMIRSLKMKPIANSPKMKLSIITINYNNAEGLRKTLASVASQTFRDFEHIIVDGGSTDGSVEIIEAYASDMARMASGSVLMGSNGNFVAVDSQDSTLANGAQPHEVTQPAASTQPSIKWISEKDKGIYNAMNKGACYACGEYLLFLNSGDRFVENGDVLEMVVRYLHDDDLIYGYMYHDFQGKMLSGVYINPEYVSFDSMRYSSLPHPCTFIKNESFVKIGGYDESYKIISDWAFMMRGIFKYNFSFRRMPIDVSIFDLNGISSTMIKEVNNEKEHFLHKEFPLFMVDYESWDRYKSKFYIKWINNIRTFKNRILKNKVQ